MKLLIDTNIILDAMINREPWAEDAQNVILAIAEEKAEGYITASSVTDIYYILFKHIKNRDQVKQALLGLLTVINVFDVNETDCVEAFSVHMSDYEDALLASCGKRHKVDRIVTRNIKDFTGSPIQAVEPHEILKYLCECIDHTESNNKQ